MNKTDETLDKTETGRPQRFGRGLAALFGEVGYDWNTDNDIAQQFKTNIKTKNVRNKHR